MPNSLSHPLSSREMKFAARAQRIAAAIHFINGAQHLRAEINHSPNDIDGQGVEVCYRGFRHFIPAKYLFSENLPSAILFHAIQCAEKDLPEELKNLLPGIPPGK